MVAQLLRLRLLSIENDFRDGVRRAVEALVAFVVVVLVSLAAAWAANTLHDDSARHTGTLIVGVGTLVLVGFAAVPFARRRATWAEPRRLAGYGLGTDVAAGGLALAGFVGLPAVSLVVLAFGVASAWGPRETAAAVVGVVIAVATAHLLGLVASATSTLITSRRMHDLVIAIGAVVGALLVPVVVAVIAAALPDGSGEATARTGARLAAATPSTLTSVLSLTPFGAALALPAHAAAGDTGRVVLDVVVAAVTLGLLWWAWRALVFHALNRPLGRAAMIERPRLGWFEVVRATPAGAVAARSLTYWSRDSRYRWPLVVLPFVPLIVVPLGVVGASWPLLALVPVPVMCLLIGFLPHNDLAHDSTALWMHVAANIGGVADRVGRVVPPLVLGLPIAIVGSFVASSLNGRQASFAPELGVCLSLLLSGLGLASVLSATLPYPAVRPGGDPFQQPQHTGSGSGWSQSIMIAGSLALTLPAGWLAVRATMGDHPELGMSALWVGVATGVLVLVIGVALGGRVFARRAPELMAFALRS